MSCQPRLHRGRFFTGIRVFILLSSAMFAGDAPVGSTRENTERAGEIAVLDKQVRDLQRSGKFPEALEKLEG